MPTNEELIRTRDALRARAQEARERGDQALADSFEITARNFDNRIKERSRVRERQRRAARQVLEDEVRSYLSRVDLPWRSKEAERFPEKGVFAVWWRRERRVAVYAQGDVFASADEVVVEVEIDCPWEGAWAPAPDKFSALFED